MTDPELIAHIAGLMEKATPCKDVEVMWYPMKDGTACPQFETDTGRIAQEDADYILYAALRTSAPRLLQLARMGAAAEGLETALRGLYDDQMDYIRLNHLSGAENNHWMVAASAALTAYASATKGE